MSLAAERPLTRRTALSPTRKTALAAGVLYLITFVSIPTLALYKPLLDHRDFVLGSGSSTGVVWGAATEVIVALAGIGTAVVLFPMARRQSETAALGFVASRVIEGGLILLGVISVLTTVALRPDAGSANTDSAALVP